MKVFLFPGQGARNVLSGLELARSLQPQLVEVALAETGLTLAQVNAEGGRALERTDVLQPLLTACSLAVHAALLARSVRPDVVLGHSLGEIAAASAAGAFDAETAIKLAAARGRLMYREAQKTPGALFAAAERDPSLELAAHHAPDEWVMGGPMEAFKPGLKKLDVSGAWHTSVMRGAVEELKKELEAAAPLRVPMVRNLDGELTKDTSTLAEQIAKPVQLAACFERVKSARVFITVGPGLVLRGLARKNLGDAVRVLTTEDRADLEALA
ncbi:MAG: ACP S-malonyltransferase [Myxococcaceae bacterium]|nr:ACP S-malonyltransferase [Myxococcaceae bacterium]